VEGCGASSGLDVPTGNGCHSDVTGKSGGSDNRGAIQEKTYIRLLVSPKRIILSLFSIYAHVFWSFMKTHPLDKSIMVTLEYMPSKHVKLLDCLSDLQEPLINWIFSRFPQATSSGPI